MAVLGLADAAARRLARNASLILMDETNLHRMIDPSAGSGAIEALTEALCEKAWQLFQLVEGQRHVGDAGFAAGLANGFVQEMIRDTRDGLLRDIAVRRRSITGVSEFPNIDEAPVEVLMPIPFREAGAGLPVARLAEPYEMLRDRADAVRTRTGSHPKVFLASLGRIADFSSRAGFARNAFEAGGIEAIGKDGFWEGEGTNLVAMTEAFRASGASLACIASSDDIYAEEAADAAMALMASGARAIWLTGRPGEAEAKWRAAGISGFLHARCDMLLFLDGALKLCEVSE
jgi:methylmalonyl-CoA mutase